MSAVFFGRGPQVVAEELQGLTLRVGSKQAIIINARPYDRAGHLRGIYAPMIDMSAGSVYCPKMMQHILLCIVTGKGRAVGSCVLIDDIELRGNRYDGPGKVTAGLGITAAKARGTATVEGLCVNVELDHLPIRISRRSPHAGSVRKPAGIGEAALGRLMPAIIEKWLAEKALVGAHDYINQLLSECSTEAELRKRVL